MNFTLKLHIAKMRGQVEQRLRRREYHEVLMLQVGTKTSEVDKS